MVANNVISRFKMYMASLKLSKNYNEILFLTQKNRDVFKDNALTNCHVDLEEKVKAVFNTAFSNDKFLFNDEKDSAVMEKAKKGAKNFSLLCLAHMVSNLTMNSRDYDKEVVGEISELITEIYEKARKVSNRNQATPEDYAYDVKSIFTADRFARGNFDHYGKEEIKNTKERVEYCFTNPRKISMPEIDRSRFKKRELYQDDIVYQEDIDFSFIDFYNDIYGNMWGVDKPIALLESIRLINLIRRYDEQHKKDLKIGMDSYSNLTDRYQKYLDDMIEDKNKNDDVYAQMQREYEEDIFKSNK